MLPVEMSGPMIGQALPDGHHDGVDEYKNEDGSVSEGVTKFVQFALT